MALAAGSVSVDVLNVATGTGLAKALYDAEASQITSDAALSTSDKHALLVGLAGRCTRLAGALLTYLTANAEVTVKVSSLDVGLQTSTAVGAPTGPHALPAPIELATKGTLG
ncbi:MAG: hypothetical protein AMXMBFR56_76930 [Polyangiaceae bacterium]